METESLSAHTAVAAGLSHSAGSWRRERPFHASTVPASCGESWISTTLNPAMPRGRIVIPIRPQVRSIDSVAQRWSEAARNSALVLLRFSLASVFLWFGLLKVANVSPVIGLLKGSFPFLAASPYIEMLGMAEIVIAVGLVIDKLSKQATVLMILHLLGTLTVVIVAPGLIFAPAFPVLTMGGEFLLKNLVLITAGLVIVFSRER
jgi:putative oxidoreductase